MSHRPADIKDFARRDAWRLVAAWLDGRRERVVDDAPLTGDARDIGLTRELALGMVRWQRLYDAVCDPLLRRGEQPRALRIALRMLCHQLFACDRIPPHAALHATVEAAKNNGAGHLAGVVNAVGRKLVERVAAERHGDGPLGRLRSEHHPRSPGERHSLPDLLVQDLKPVLPGDTDTALAALNHVPPLCTRTMPGAAPPVGRSILRRDEAWTWWEDPQEALAGPVADGRCVVQDRAQGEVLAALRPRPGERVLDLCAAPGGKARACAEAGCRVIAADLAGPRQARLRANGTGRFAILAQDGRRPALAAGAFDAVLVDAPCSNSGVLGRRPEARWRYDRASLASLTTLQRGLLAAAAGLVAPGGRLVYSTCSLSPGENQRIAQALAGWRVLAERLTWPDAWQGGGYVAVLVRC